MRISDWSSDVCSSDLAIGARLDFLPIVIAERGNLDLAVEMADVAHDGHVLHRLHVLAGDDVFVARGSDEHVGARNRLVRSEEHTSELQSLIRISFAVFCFTKKNNATHNITHNLTTTIC